MFAENKRAIRNKGALDGRIDAERTGALEPPFEPCAFFKEPGPFTVIASIRRKPPPSHANPPLLVLHQRVVNSSEVTTVVVLKD